MQAFTFLRTMALLAIGVVLRIANTLAFRVQDEDDGP
jgi:hypothetical protein